jgi:hypothetical protein
MTGKGRRGQERAGEDRKDKDIIVLDMTGTGQQRTGKEEI